MTAVDDGAEDLRDATLRLVLAHAPDHTAVPHWRLRKSILEEAHEAVGAVELAPRDIQARPWWKRLLLGDGSARMPWNAALATVAVATLVTVMWQREPVPDARLDGEATPNRPLAREEAPSQRPASPATPSTPAAPSTSDAATAPSAPTPTAPAPLPEAEPNVTSPAPVTPESAASARPFEPSTPPAAPPTAATAPDRSQVPEPPEPATPLVLQRAPETVAPAPPPAREPSLGATRRQRDEDMRAEPRRADRFEAEKKAAPVPPALRAPAPPAEANASAGFAAPGGAANAARSARAAAPSVRTEATEPPTFAALAQWQRVTITPRGGASRSLTRSEALDLNALLGSAAITAVGAKPLTGTPEWRVTLERDGKTLAVFDVARSQVRWREGTAPAATGAPSAPALAALNDALRNALQTPEPEALPLPAAPPRNP